MAEHEVDVAVIGAGPAGCAAARLLSSWGHSVVLLGRAPRRGFAESLPPSCTKLLEQLGVRQLVDDAGFIRATGNTVQWAGGERRVERFASGQTGYQVLRGPFDALLIDAARAAGVTVHRSTTVRDVEPNGSELRVWFSAESSTSELRARWVLDCSGRTGVIARRGLRRAESSARTTAIIAEYESSSPWPTEDDTHTLVESFAGGWAWSVPVTSRRRFVTVMLDPSVTELPGRRLLADAFAAELSHTTMIRDLVANAQMVGDVLGWDASPYTASRAYDNEMLLVGDAASFVDPLSSFGVKKALASAWLASVVVHTALDDAPMATPALDLYAQREREMYEQLQRRSTALSQEAAGAHPGEFWAGRADVTGDEVTDGLDVTTLRTDPCVLAAFDEIKRRPFVNLRQADSVRVVERAIVRGHRVVLEDHLASPSMPHGVRYCRNVDLVLIARLADRYDQVPDLFDAYNRAAPPVPLPDFLGALSALVGLKFLEFA